MEMIGKEGPGIAGRKGFSKDLTETLYEAVTIGVVSKNFSLLNSSTDDVV